MAELKPWERNCCLTLDEMSITPGMEFDKSSGTVIGNVTLPGHSGTATHILVFMLGGKCRPVSFYLITSLISALDFYIYDVYIYFFFLIFFYLLYLI